MATGMRAPGPKWQTVVGIAARQRGVVSIRDLRRAGVGSTTTKRWSRTGRLQRVHRGVYLIPGARSGETLEMAAVLACGPGAVISHGSAARLWKLPRFQAEDGPIAVSVESAGRRPRPGLRIHRVASLDRDHDVRDMDGLPLTAPARTLIDVATGISLMDLESTYADARVRGLIPPGELSQALARNRCRPGAAAIRRLVALTEDGDRRGPTRSEAERRLLALLRAADLPRPETNARVGRFEVDLLWRRHGLIVEVDGYAFHSGRRAFEHDRDRDAALIGGGYVVARVTWRQITARPEAVVARIAQALALRSPREGRVAERGIAPGTGAV